MSITTETVYTAWAMTIRGREEIECYGTVEEAVQDMLELWPEEAGEGIDASDVVIEEDAGYPIVWMARGSNPYVVHVFHLGEVGTIRTYKCHYEPSLGGSVRTIIQRLS